MSEWKINMPKGWEPGECKKCPDYSICGLKEMGADCPLSHAVPVKEQGEVGLKMGCGVCQIINANKHELAMAAELVNAVKMSKIMRMVQPTISTIEEILTRYGFTEVRLPRPPSNHRQG